MFSAIPVDSVRNPYAQGWSIARRLSGLQALAALFTASGWLLRSPNDAMAAAVGGLAVALGTWLLGRGMFSGSGVSATRALAGLIVGSLVRWLTIASCVALAVGWAKLPPLPLLSGLIVAFLVQLFGMRFAVRGD